MPSEERLGAKGIDEAERISGGPTRYVPRSRERMPSTRARRPGSANHTPLSRSSSSGEDASSPPRTRPREGWKSSGGSAPRTRGPAGAQHPGGPLHNPRQGPRGTGQGSGRRRAARSSRRGPGSLCEEPGDLRGDRPHGARGGRNGRRCGTRCRALRGRARGPAGALIRSRFPARLFRAPRRMRRRRCFGPAATSSAGSSPRN